MTNAAGLTFRHQFRFKAVNAEEMVTCARHWINVPIQEPFSQMTLVQCMRRLSVSPFNSFGEFICSKGSNSIGYRVDWCKNYRLQSSQFVGRPEEEEEESYITSLHHK